MSPLWRLCLSGKLAEVRAALARGQDVNIKDEGNQTGLMWAVDNKHNSVVRLLLEQPTTDLNRTDLNGETALHHAAVNGNVEAVQLLLADPRLTTANLQNKNGLTPAMCAVMYKHVNALHELVAHPNVNLGIGWGGKSLEEYTRWAFHQYFIEISYWTLLIQGVEG